MHSIGPSQSIIVYSHLNTPNIYIPYPRKSKTTHNSLPF